MKFTKTRKTSEIENITTNHDHDKYITTQEFNRLTSENFTAWLARENLARKSDIISFVKKTNFDKLKNSIKSSTLNKIELNELSKIVEWTIKNS